MYWLLLMLIETIIYFDRVSRFSGHRFVWTEVKSIKVAACSIYDCNQCGLRENVTHSLEIIHAIGECTSADIGPERSRKLKNENPHCSILLHCINTLYATYVHVCIRIIKWTRFKIHMSIYFILKSLHWYCFIH